MFSSLGFGLGLIIAGLVSVLLVLALLRLLPRNQAKTPVPLSAMVMPGSLETNDGVVIIQSGGRVEHLNSSARQLFGLHENEFADLERLARRVRPSDDFLALCSEEGQKQITIGANLTEATSYRIPGFTPLMFMTLRNLSFAPAFSSGEEIASAAVLRVMADFGQAIAASLRLDDTLRAILDYVGRLISADIVEVQIWDESRQSLLPYRYDQHPDELRKLVQAAHSAFGDLSKSMIAEHKALFLSNVAPSNRSAANGFGGSGAVYAYIGAPLLVGDKFIGTLEAGQLAPDSFGQHDVDMLQLLAGQAGIAIRNAILYEAEQRRAAELAGLANLAQAISGSQTLKDLFEKLVNSIAPLFDFDIIGFLLFDEDKRTLEGQIPFQGLPPHIVEMYRTNVSVNEIAADLIDNRQPILTLNASQDAQWQVLGIQNLAQAASLRDSALMPLISGRRLIGFLQLSNHKQGVVDFKDEELRLMEVIANQATAVIENAVLVQQSRQRAYRSDALRRIASLSASAASLDEVLEHSVRELVHLFQADTAAIFLLDEPNGELVLHNGSLYGVQPEAAKEFSRMFVGDAQFRLTVTGSQKSFISGHLSSDRRILPVYRPIVSALRVESALVVPLAAREQSWGELMLGSRKAEFFNSYDLQVVTTAAGQLATALESARLAEQTDENLRARVDQLTALMRISRELTASLNLRQVLEVVHDESLRTTRAECGTILLFDAPANGSEPSIQLALGCPVDATLQVLMERILHSGETLVIPDFQDSDIVAPHDGVRSALLVPILQQGKVAGAIHLHAAQPGFFGSEMVELVQTMAVQASIAVNAASQYQSERQRAEALRQRADAMSRLTEINHAMNSEQSLEQQLRAIGNGIRETTPFQAVLFSVYEPETGLLRRVFGMGFPQDNLNELLSRKQPLSSVQQLFKPEFRISRSYFIPADQTPVIPADMNMVTLDLAETNAVENAWDPDDFLLTPLMDAQGNPLGLVSVDAPLDGLRPDKATIETIETFAAQAALIINNATRFTDMRNRIETLTAGLQRQQRLLSVGQNDLPLLLHKDLEQTVSIHNLDRRAQRMRAGLAITESVSRQLDASSALQALGREILTQLGMSVALVAEDSPEGPSLLHALGSVPRATSPETLFGQRNPLRSCLQTGETILFANLDDTEEWRDTPLLNGLRAKAFICLPIKVEDRVVAAILAVSPEPMPPFTNEDRHVYRQIARQASVVLQNIHLLNETRRRLQEVDLLLDFSRQISGLDPAHIVKALLESARRVIQAAHAGTALLWDEVASLLVPIIASGYADNESLMKISYRSGEALIGSVFERGTARRLDELDFAREYALSPENLLLYRQATGGRLPVSCLVIPVVASGQSLGVLVLDNFNTQAAFKPEDETLLLSLSQQVALSLENVRLVHSSQERAGQLQALNDVAASMTASLRSDELVASLLDQLKPVLPYDTATLLLRNEDLLVVAAARGFADDERRLGLTVSVTDSALFQEMIRAGQPICVGDVRGDARFPQIEAPHLSWLGIPLISKGEVIGVLALEKWQANFYKNELVQIASTFAGQAAVALENAHLYEESLNRAAELDQRSQRLALLNRFSSRLSGLLDANQIQQVTAEELLKAFGAYRVSVVNLESQTPIWTYATPDDGQLLPISLPDVPIFAHMRDSLGVITREDALKELDLLPLTPMLGEESTSLLVLPLASGTNLRSALFVQLHVRTRFNAAEIELGLTIANQASIALESARLFAETQRLAEELEQRVVERTAELEREKANTETLLRILSEVSASLDLDRALSRTLALLNEAVGAEQGTVMLLQADDNLLHYRAGYGYLTGKVPTEGHSFTLKVGEGLAGWVVEHRESVLVLDLHRDPRWVRSGSVSNEHRSSIATPLLVGEDVIGVLMVFHRQASFFGPERLGMVKAIAGQVAIAINNAHLYELIRDQAERLGSMLRKEQEEASRSQAILEAVADGVVVTSPQNKITFLNKSAVNILGLSAEKMVGQPLDAFGGIFGKAASTWMQTINNWSSDPASHQVGDSYAEQLELEDGRIALVHLAPVILQNDFLGTVSIFRDVTHEVEVDRLKSEFVATVSHELRTPMTSIRGYVDILLMGAAGALNENQTHFLQIVKNNTERLNILVNDLLDISRIESGRVTLSPQPVNLRDVAEDVLADALRRSQEEKKPIAFALDAVRDLPRVYGDAERIRQVIGNLVDNAYRYTPKNGQVTVRVHASNGNHVQVDVQDTGVGIPLEDQDRIFDRFFRGEDPLVLATPGTGLGLAIVKQLVEMHNGRIWIQSEGSGKGSTFSFTLPAYTMKE
jgi:PAS domain S-box-containing protein